MSGPGAEELLVLISHLRIVIAALVAEIVAVPAHGVAQRHTRVAAMIVLSPYRADRDSSFEADDDDRLDAVRTADELACSALSPSAPERDAAEPRRENPPVEPFKLPRTGADLESYGRSGRPQDPSSVRRAARNT
jgi:hypothetical protein